MLDDLLQFGTIFDWISPAASIAGDIANGGGHTFMLPQDCGWTGGEVDKLLRENGIKTWGQMLVCGTIMITVHPSQAGRASYLLQRSGLATGPAPAPTRRQVYQRRPRRRTIRRRSRGFGRVFSMHFGV